ncbi:unnamed protein product [Heterobilharzia americana]|nr:unnamed protein product [Heterobilharzia americana]
MNSLVDKNSLYVLLAADNREYTSKKFKFLSYSLTTEKSVTLLITWASLKKLIIHHNQSTAKIDKPSPCK